MKNVLNDYSSDGISLQSVTVVFTPLSLDCYIFWFW